MTPNGSQYSGRTTGEQMLFWKWGGRQSHFIRLCCAVHFRSYTVIKRFNSLPARPALSFSLSCGLLPSTSPFSFPQIPTVTFDTLQEDNLKPVEFNRGLCKWGRSEMSLSDTQTVLASLYCVCWCVCARLALERTTENGGPVSTFLTKGARRW